MQTQINLNNEYTFDNFIIGYSNKFAFNAALELAKCASRIYNPLFIYSNHGLGKTHLLHAIGNYILNIDPTVKILYISIEKFVNELITAIKDDKRDDFIHRFTSIDVLLVDDIQFIFGKERTQEEFFHILRKLYLEGKQVVLAATKAPKDIEYFDSNFSSIFDIGLTVEITAAEIETKCSILRMYRCLTNSDLSDEIIEIISGKTENIRELKAYFNNVIAYSSFMDEPLCIEMVSKILT